MQRRAVLLQRWAFEPLGSTEDSYEYIAMIFMNLARLKEARTILLGPGHSFLSLTASQLDSLSLIRRQGCAGIMRNCCFSAEVRLCSRSSIRIHDICVEIFTNLHAPALTRHGVMQRFNFQSHIMRT